MDRWDNEHPEFSVLKGKILTRIIGKEGDDTLTFETWDGQRYQLYHSQDCCESVALEEVVGDLQDLLGEPLLEAEEVSSEDFPAPKYQPESYTWTFYKLSTRRASVTLRWLGTSNGYYSEGVSFCRLRPQDH